MISKRGAKKVENQPNLLFKPQDNMVLLVKFSLNYKSLQSGMAAHPIGTNKKSIKQIDSCTNKFVDFWFMLKNKTFDITFRNIIK